MTSTEIILLCGAAFVGSSFNAVAGGGSFFVFPALLFAGVPVINANAINTISLWPGAVSSAYQLKAHLKVEKKIVWQFALLSIFGSLIGTSLFVFTPESVLNYLLPFLLLSATLILAFQTKITDCIQNNLSVGYASIFLFFIAVYGGYFGGGIGILMLATLSMMGFTNLLQMNAFKSFLVSLINGMCVLYFVFLKLVYWEIAIYMIAFGIMGGLFGTYILKSVNAKFLHKFIICVGFFVSVYLFCKYYL